MRELRSLQHNQNANAILTRLTSRYPLTQRKAILAGDEWCLWAVEDEDALIARVQTDEDLAAFPFGLMLWASAVALAEAIVETPHLVKSRRVLELGAGVGLPGLIAAHRGALEVTQTDYQADALALCRANALTNRAPAAVRQRIADWRAFPFELVGEDAGPLTVIASDVLYERTLHEPLRAVVSRLLVAAPDTVAVLADPLRPQAEAFWASAPASWNIQTERRRVEWNGRNREIALYTVRWINRP